MSTMKTKKRMGKSNMMSGNMMLNKERNVQSDGNISVENE